MITRQEAQTYVKRYPRGIVCLETGEIYKSIKAAAEQTSSIYSQVRRSVLSGGKTATSDEQHFDFMTRYFNVRW